MTHRAYSFLEVKAVSENERVIRGIATSPEVDRVGDIVEPLGVKFKNPMPLLWQHRHDSPVGTVKFEKPTKNGIEFEARLPVIEEMGALRDRIEEAWQSVKAGLVRAVSIGFRALEYSYMDGGGIKFSESEVYELSLVTIPANSGALITSFKSLDPVARESLISRIKAADQAARRAALGHTAGNPVVRLDAGLTGKSPGASGTSGRRPGAVYLNS